MVKKKNKGLNNILVVLVLVLSICLVSSVSYIVYDKLSNDDVVENEGNSKDEVDDVEKENDSITLNNTMKRYVEILEKLKVIGDYSTDNTFGRGVIYANNFKNSDISETDKLYVVLEQLYVENRGKSPVTTDYNFGSDYIKSVSTQIEVSDVEKLYKDLFGSSDIQHENRGKCPHFTYDALNSKYYGAAECGGTSSLGWETYVYSVTTKGDNVYVYVSLATRDMANVTPIIYTDFAMTKVYSGTVLDAWNIINENNYNDFSQYKYVFTKNDDSYSFKKIEKIK